jgi:SAM-dependent methyltransferase
MSSLSADLERAVRALEKSNRRWFPSRRHNLLQESVVTVLSGLVDRLDQLANKQDAETSAVQKSLADLSHRLEQANSKIRGVLDAQENRHRALVSRMSGLAEHSEIRTAAISRAIQQLFDNIDAITEQFERHVQSGELALKEIDSSVARVSKLGAQKFEEATRSLHETTLGFSEQMTSLQSNVHISLASLAAANSRLDQEFDALKNATRSELAVVQERAHEHEIDVEKRWNEARTEIAGTIDRWTALTDASNPAARIQEDPDFIQFYLELERKHRGTRQLIIERLRQYTTVIQGWSASLIDKIVSDPLIDFRLEQPTLSKDLVGSPISEVGQLPALDLGCGRGEWLEFLGSLGWQNFVGVDSNRDMVKECRRHGLPAIDGDAITFIETLPSSSVALITGFHIVEHLPFDVLRKLVRETYRVLCKSGLCIFETPNPENVLTASQYFHLDPTHNRPLPPDLMVLALEHVGFEDIEILRMQPNSDLGYVPDSLPKKHADPTVQLLLNHFRACRDYAVIARRP